MAKITESFFTEKAFDQCRITCQIIPMGKDITILIYGGSKPHIGSTVLAQARPSLTGNGISVTSSVINVAGHKDEAVARMFAEKMAVHGNCTTVCACGIHMDAITHDQLEKVQVCCRILLERCLKTIE